MDQVECEQLNKNELKYQDKISKIVGIPFAIVAMPSFALAFLGTFAFGIFAIYIALPGLVALVVSMVGYVALTRKSERREEELRIKLREMKSSP